MSALVKTVTVPVAKTWEHWASHTCFLYLDIRDQVACLNTEEQTLLPLYHCVLRNNIMPESHRDHHALITCEKL